MSGNLIAGLSLFSIFNSADYLVESIDFSGGGCKGLPSGNSLAAATFGLKFIAEGFRIALLICSIQA